MELLACQVVQLERQLEMYRSVVTQHHVLMTDVYRVLGQGEQTSVVASLQRRVFSLIEKQSATLQHAHFKPSAVEKHWDPVADAQGRMDHREEPEKEVEVLPFTSSCALPQCTETESLVAVAAEDTTKRVQDAVVRLLKIWFDHVRGKVHRLLGVPQEKFQLFHEAPTEDSLAAFMDSFHLATTEVLGLLSSSGGDLGPVGNPFQVDDRLRRLILATVSDSINNVVRAAPTTRPAAPLAEMSVNRDKERPSIPVPPLMVPKSSLPEATILHANRSFAATPARSPAPSTRATSTPASRHVLRGVNDSSQVRNIFGPIDVPRPMRIGNPTSVMENNGKQVSSVETPRLLELKDVLCKIEFQLSGLSHQKVTGSEAKYYALNKKLQKVRAEVLKEQRESDQVALAAAELHQQRRINDEHRRVFRR